MMSEMVAVPQAKVAAARAAPPASPRSGRGPPAPPGLVPAATIAGMSETVQLLLCQKLAREAEIRLKQPNDFDKAIAVSMMHDAVELLLWTACKEHNALVTDRSTLVEMLKQPTNASQPEKEELREILVAYLDEDAGNDWARWDAAVQKFLKENAE